MSPAESRYWSNNVTLKDFYDRVQQDNEMRGIDATNGTCTIEEIRTGIHTRVPKDTIRHHTWDRLRDVILGVCNAIVLYHVSRIVGYFSRIENWNPAKIGELRDRRKGNYAIHP